MERGDTPASGRILCLVLALSASMAAQQPRTKPTAVQTVAFRPDTEGKHICARATTYRDGGFLVTGRFTGTVDFEPGKARLVRTSRGRESGYLARYRPDGSCQWVVQFNSTKLAGAAEVIVPADGSILVQGGFAGKLDLDPAADRTLLLESRENATFVARYDPNGRLLEGHKLKIPGMVYRFGMDRGGRYFATGIQMSTPAQVKNRKPDAVVRPKGFLTMHDHSGKLMWVKRDLGFMATDLAVDSTGRIYVSGTRQYREDPDKPSSMRRSTLLACFDTKGNPLWHHAFKAHGGQGLGGAAGLACDDKGAVYLASRLDGEVDIDPGPKASKLRARHGILVARFGKGGELLNGFAIEGDGGTLCSGLAIDGIGDIYLLGQFNRTLDVDPGKGTHLLEAGHRSEFHGVFAAKYNPAGRLIRVWHGRVVVAEHQAHRGNYLIGLAVDRRGQQMITTGLFANDLQIGSLRVRCRDNRRGGLVLRWSTGGSNK